jgi:serine/threonine-protein kinase HipA
MKKRDEGRISKIEVSLRWNSNITVPVGTLFSPSHGGIVFEFHNSFLASGLSISPFKLSHQTGAQVARTEHSGFGGLFGVFSDSLPDGWGLLLMARGPKFLRQ